MKLAAREICSGCAGCHDICPRQAITMMPDDEGFLYPNVNMDKCVDCGLCTQACPSINVADARSPLSTYAAKAKDQDLRIASSSGGVFSLLARRILKRGGKVYGAAFDQGDWSVRHIGIGDEIGLGELRGSKYVQSRTVGIYNAVKDDLKHGRSVLFSGTPCQVAALRRVVDLDWTLEKCKSGLTLVEVACHAVSSPLVWQKYIALRSKGNMIRRISFRRKDCGWRRYSVSFDFVNDTEYRCCFSEDPYMRAFLHELSNRPSCYKCQCKNFRSGADLTIADFWGIENVRSNFADDIGVSAVLVDAKKGEALLNSIAEEIDFEYVAYDDILRSNHALVRSASRNNRREEFFYEFQSKDFKVLVDALLRKTLAKRMKCLLRKFLKRIK